MTLLWLSTGCGIRSVNFCTFMLEWWLCILKVWIIKSSWNRTSQDGRSLELVISMAYISGNILFKKANWDSHILHCRQGYHSDSAEQGLLSWESGCSCLTMPIPFEISLIMELFMCSWWMTWSCLQCVPMVAQMEFECLSLHRQVKVSSLLIYSALVTPNLWSARSSTC